LGNADARGLGIEPLDEAEGDIRQQRGDEYAPECNGHGTLLFVFRKRLPVQALVSLGILQLFADT
jgi:hypothetical protein